MLLASSLFAQDRIIDTSKILQDNQSLVIDAKTNEINYILEIAPNGKIIKKYLSGAQQETLKNQLGLQNVEIFDNQIHTNTAIKEWSKAKILYEQQVEKIPLKR